jgi:hypothetical protein
MNTRNHRKIAVFAALVFATLLTGCLTKEQSGSELANNSTVAENSAPTISGNPQNTIIMGDRYSFMPNASDPDGDDLEFNVQNLPIWAVFDTVTGEVSGQPSTADVGVFDNVVISVSDGAASAALPAFSITVSQVALGSVALSWTPPTTNIDGSALTDLAGYRIYYGTSEGNYPNRVDIGTAGISTYIVENLVPQTYYFVITSLNVAGTESSFSNVAIKVLS